MRNKKSERVIMPDQVTIEKSVSSVEVKFGQKKTELTIKVYDDDITTAGKLAVAELEKLLLKIRSIDKKFRKD